ncbi:MAG TPA: PocR ligand-binding domain-containing protein [Terracidiphilus sp.]|jgi:AraC-like DNA-binding protein/ligand-binding sensor protein|nr:PocR ligand-binding domain-containing protein [Terracidiphilus sp.]
MKRQKEALNETLKQEFKKDLELFEYFLVLLNSSSPIRNVELMWADDLELFDPTQQPRVNTGNALVQLQPAGADVQGRSSPSPSTHFCDLVHGFGAHEEQTCARSDKPAKERCRATGRSDVYPCHVGLTDIAVPVICEGRYLGTLFSGQVLTASPTADGFARVRAALEGQPHIDLARLEEAYYRVPVVTTAQLAEMVRMMEVFARYLSNAWKRLEIMSEFQQVRERELELDRRELAEMLLSGQVDSGAAANLETLRVLARNVGLERLPDRVLVLRLETGTDELAKPDRADLNRAKQDGANQDGACHEKEMSAAGEIGNRLTLGRVAHMIVDRCRSWPNTLATVVTPGEMCIFTSQKSRTPSHERMLLDEIGQALLRSARSQGLLMARIGISGLHPQPTGLLRAYHEAASALDAGHSTLNWFEALPERQQQPAQALGRVLKALQAAEPGAITAALREFLAAAAPAGASVAQLQQGRGLLTWACEHLTRELSSLGASPEPMNSAKERAIQIIMGSPSSFAMAEAFRAFVEQLRLLIVQLFGQREQKIVSETQRLVREIGPEKATIQRLALDLKLSAGHLGRVYSRTTGHTLEEYLIRQKLEMSKRLLLDPRLHVAEVADRCGFCNPAYFASVFKKYMQCTPRAYASEPQRWGALEASALEPEVLLAR